VNRSIAIRRRTGVTLVELLVTLAIMALLTAIALPALSRKQSRSDEDSDLIQQLRRHAIMTGTVVTRTILIEGRPHLSTALPDGRVLTDTLVQADMRDGKASRNRPHNSTQ
jgi:prepilin-type N-terminal cleavage/methylation domain-containing protein